MLFNEYSFFRFSFKCLVIFRYIFLKKNMVKYYLLFNYTNDSKYVQTFKENISKKICQDVKRYKNRNWDIENNPQVFCLFLNKMHYSLWNAELHQKK